MSVFVPLNEYAEVLEATCSSLISAREFSSSSVSPSEKYSCSLSPLMFTNGSTAMECGGGAKAAGDGVKGLVIQNLSAMRANAAKTTTPTVTNSAGLDHEDPRTGCRALNVVSDTKAAGRAAAARSGSGDRRRRTRSAKAGGASPAGRRVHCTRLKDSGTSVPAPGVASRQTGMINARSRAIIWVR